MAAVKTEEDFDTCILEPLRVLMQGIDPDQTPVPFSPYTLQFECIAEKAVAGTTTGGSK
jgi:hypothetical protein